MEGLTSENNWKRSSLMPRDRGGRKKRGHKGGRRSTIQKFPSETEASRWALYTVSHKRPASRCVSVFSREKILKTQIFILHQVEDPRTENTVNQVDGRSSLCLRFSSNVIRQAPHGGRGTGTVRFPKGFLAFFQE